MTEPQLSPERTSELRELDMYERVQGRIVHWFRRRFWTVIFVGTFFIGASGYGLVRTLLSEVEKAAVTAEVKADYAAEKADRAAVALAASNLEINGVQSRLELLRTETDEFQPRIVEVMRTLDDFAGELDTLTKLAETMTSMSEQVQIDLQTFGDRIGELGSDQRQLYSQLERDIEELNDEIGDFRTRFSSSLDLPEPEMKNVESLLKIVESPGNNFFIRSTYAEQLASRGKGMPKVASRLKELIDVTSYPSESLHGEFIKTDEFKFSYKLVSSYVQIVGISALHEFIPIICDVTNPEVQRWAVVSALIDAKPTWTAYYMRSLKKCFTETDWLGRESIVILLNSPQTDLTDHGAAIIAQELLVEALTTKKPTSDDLYLKAANTLRNVKSPVEDELLGKIENRLRSFAQAAKPLTLEAEENDIFASVRSEEATRGHILELLVDDLKRKRGSEETFDAKITEAPPSR